jgi:hypothetical protein
MIYGILCGLTYAILGFSGIGKPPKICFTCGPFRDGMLWVNGYHVHHWVMCSVTGLLAIMLRWYDLAAFSAIMVAHGVSYADAFQFEDQTTSATQTDLQSDTT